MNLLFAAGIIPYTILENGQCYFLLGLEESNNKWSGFVGSSERGESVIETAFREFNEESAFVLDSFNEYTLSKLLNTQPVIEKTSTSKTAYLYFIKYPIFNLNINEIFQYNKSQFTKKEFHEKKELRWFSLDEIKKSNVLYRLKKTIIHLFF
jgi:8-oxo-dGTP pyrophosphatase MutT (NUDIX family)